MRRKDRDQKDNYRSTFKDKKLRNEPKTLELKILSPNQYALDLDVEYTLQLVNEIIKLKKLMEDKRKNPTSILKTTGLIDRELKQSIERFNWFAASNKSGISPLILINNLIEANVLFTRYNDLYTAGELVGISISKFSNINKINLIDEKSIDLAYEYLLSNPKILNSQPVEYPTSSSKGFIPTRLKIFYLSNRIIDEQKYTLEYSEETNTYKYDRHLINKTITMWSLGLPSKINWKLFSGEYREVVYDAFGLTDKNRSFDDVMKLITLYVDINEKLNYPIPPEDDEFYQEWLGDYFDEIDSIKKKEPYDEGLIEAFSKF